MAFKPGVDPTTIRLSPHFLLSDFMGCHSVYARGLKNIFTDPQGTKIPEGRYLCEQLLEPILTTYGPLSISYGYISPDLSKQIVTYQDPNKPSYHRWDKGAAADICVHAWVRKEAPIFLAHAIDEQFPYSRMITYSESPFICVASQIDEGANARRAFYENRYTGKKGAKPQYIKKSSHAGVRAVQGAEIELEHDWKGAGYPTYHGGGLRQYQHTRTSRFSVASDFLYSTHALRTGLANIPDFTKFGESFRRAGQTYDELLIALDVPRLSIVRAFESFRFNDYPLFSWKDHFAIDFIPPEYIDANDAAAVAIDLMQLSGLINTVSVDNTTGIVRVVGVPNEEAV